MEAEGNERKLREGKEVSCNFTQQKQQHNNALQQQQPIPH